jgi:hypothetical protein
VDDAPPDSEDDSSIPDDEILYRRIAHYGSGDLVAVDAITGHRRPSSGAFKSDNDGISIYLDGVLSEAGLGPHDLVRAPQNAAVAFRAAIPRQLSLGVVRDAWPTGTDDDDHPRNAAHALIVGFLGLSAKERRRRQKALAQSCYWVIDPGAPSSDP